MKTELRLAPHSQIPGASVVEIFHNGVFLGTICGHDGPGVRIISKYEMGVRVVPSPPVQFTIVEFKREE